MTYPNLGGNAFQFDDQVEDTREPDETDEGLGPDEDREYERDWERRNGI